jgi:hypothetical protein
VRVTVELADDIEELKLEKLELDIEVIKLVEVIELVEDVEPVETSVLVLEDVKVDDKEELVDDGKQIGRTS